MSEKYVLTIDCGTQSIRALIFDKNGTLLGKKKKNLNLIFLIIQAGQNRTQRYIGRIYV